MHTVDDIVDSVGTGTPFFLIRTNLLYDNIVSFRSALDLLWPNSIIAYSVKTNSLPWLLTWMNQHDIYAEVVSDEEYELAKAAGYTGDRIVFNGPIKSIQKVDLAIKEKAYINIDSKRELTFLSQNHRSGYTGIRVNVDPDIFDLSDVGYNEDGFRFGFSDSNGQFVDAIKRIGDKCIGLHLHVNSITRSVKVYRAIASFAATLIQKYQLTPSYIDIGGGFFGGVPGKTTPKEYIQTIKEELKEVVDLDKTKLIIEPGSALIGSAVELYTTVLDVKDTERARIVTTDGSRVHIDPLWQKKGYMHTLVSQGTPHPRQVICGYTCMDHDRLMVIENEKELDVGDNVVYHRVGNYTTTFGGLFIRPFPAVYAEVGENIVLVRHEMNVEDYYRLES